MSRDPRGALSMADIVPGPRGLAAAVLARAVDDARDGNLAAGAWLASEHATPWVWLAELDDWARQVQHSGLAWEGEYMAELDDLPEVGKQEHARAVVRFRKTRLYGHVITQLQAALVACDGDLAAAVGEMRGTPAGDHLRAWLEGE